MGFLKKNHSSLLFLVSVILSEYSYYFLRFLKHCRIVAVFSILFCQSTLATCSSSARPRKDNGTLANTVVEVCFHGLVRIGYLVERNKQQKWNLSYLFMENLVYIREASWLWNGTTELASNGIVIGMWVLALNALLWWLRSLMCIWS